MRNWKYRSRRRKPRSRLRVVGDWGLAIALLAAVAVVAARYDRIATQQFGGRAQVADGDTLVLDGKRIRLRGIDAPEFGQPCMRSGQNYDCGREARSALARLTQRGVTCAGSEIDKYGRLLAVCRAGKTDINRQMVREGWAVSYGDYLADELLARGEGKGIWAGDFERPRQWRDMHGNAAAAEPDHTWLNRLANWLAQIAGWRNAKEESG